MAIDNNDNGNDSDRGNDNGSDGDNYCNSEDDNNRNCGKNNFYKLRLLEKYN